MLGCSVHSRSRPRNRLVKCIYMLKRRGGSYLVGWSGLQLLKDLERLLLRCQSHNESQTSCLYIQKGWVVFEMIEI